MGEHGDRPEDLAPHLRSTPKTDASSYQKTAVLHAVGRIECMARGTELMCAADSLSLMLVMVLLGWNDGSQGPLLPFLQDYYHVRSCPPGRA